MRPKLNKIYWKVVHIAITIKMTEDEVISASSKKHLTRDEFFDRVFNYLDSKGFDPMLPIARMKTELKSPFSNSEYYTFLKVTDDKRLKVVLDIRLTDHYHINEHRDKKYTERQRHIHYMETQLGPKIIKERQLNPLSNADYNFIDVAEKECVLFDLIDIDGSLFNSYDEALVEVKHKIDDLA